ncbi:hypothetical protein TRIP_E240025 [uncultured Spirochaetota bacterium]|nr:hypothetical protein TRIP_E240025 [uncultured Spirochaetota bacterium]
MYALNYYSDEKSKFVNEKGNIIDFRINVSINLP